MNPPRLSARRGESPRRCAILRPSEGTNGSAPIRKQCSCPVGDILIFAGPVIHAAAHPERDLFAGGAGKVMSSAGKYAPRLTDPYMERSMFDQQQKPVPSRPSRRDALWEPGEGPREHGNYEGHVMRRSVYTQASLHPLLTGMLVGAADVAIAGVLGVAKATEE